MSDTNWLDELDAALIARLRMVQTSYALAAERDHDMQIGNTDVSEQSKMFAEAADRIEALTRENAKLQESEMQMSLIESKMYARATAAEAERDALREQVQALTADAERYRWLRDENSDLSFMFTRNADRKPLGLMAREMLDAAIDAARQPREDKP